MSQLTRTRLILAIITTFLEEVAIVIVWSWGLPELDIYLPFSALVAIMVGWLLVSITIFTFVTRTLRRQVVVGLPSMIGGRGKAASTLDPEGMVRVRSELWGASSTEGEIRKGENIVVVGQDGLLLRVGRPGHEKSKEKRSPSSQ